MFIVHGNHDWDGFAEIVSTQDEAKKRVASWVETCDQKKVSPRLPEDKFREKIEEAQQGGDWKHGPTVDPIKTAIVASSKAAKARLALAMLRMARDLLDEAGSKRSARRVREILASAEGAARAAEMREQRAEAETNAPSQ